MNMCTNSKHDEVCYEVVFCPACAAWQDGYDAGFDKGYEEGNDDGYRDGKNDNK